MKTLEDIKLKDILPDSIKEDKNVSATAEAIDPQLKLIAESVDVPSLYARIDELSSVVLDHLATQFDITTWRESWNISLKRSVLKTCISEKRKKGTLGAVKKAIASLGGAATVVEWWQTEPKGVPHTFTIRVIPSSHDGVITNEMQEDIVNMINDAKPVRSHYALTLQDSFKGSVGIFGCLRVGTYAIIRSTDKSNISTTGAIGAYATGRAIIKRHLIGQA